MRTHLVQQGEGVHVGVGVQAGWRIDVLLSQRGVVVGGQDGWVLLMVEGMNLGGTNSS